MALTTQQANELELLRLQRRKLELESGLQEQSQFPVARTAEVQAIEQAGLTDPSVITTPPREEGGRFPVGALVGGTVGSVVGGVPGAVLGAAAGEAGEQLVRRATGFDAPKTSLEAGGRIALEGGLAFIGEAAPRLAFGLGGKLFRTFSSRVTPEARQAINFLETNMPSTQRGRFNPLRYIYGKDKTALGLLPAEATDDKILDVVHNVAEKSVFGGQGLQDFKINRTKFFRNYADDFVNAFGEIAGADEVGDLFLATLNKKIAPSRTLATAFYNVTDDLTRGRIIRDPVTLRETVVDAALVSTKALKDFARKQLPTIEAAQGLGGAEAGDSLINSILGMKDEIGFTVAKNIRSRLRAAADGFAVINKKAPAIGLAKKMGGMLDESIDIGLTNYNNPVALDSWRTANRIYRQGSKDFDNVFLRRLIRSADPEVSGKFPETIVNNVFKRNNIGGIRVAKKALGGIDSPPWKTMQGWHSRDLLARGTKEGTLDGVKFTEAMFGRTGVGEKTMLEIYSPAQVKALKDFGNAMIEAQARQGGGTGGMLIQLAQGGALYQLATGQAGVGTAAILMGPDVLSRAITNPGIVKLLLNGFKAGTKTKVVAGTMGRFITDLVNLQRERVEARQETP